MGDVIRYFAHAVEEALDAVEHAVQMSREIVELVAGGRHRHALREIAADDLAAGAVDDVQAGEEVAADDETAGETQHDHQSRAPEERGLKQVLKRAALVHVARDEEIESLRKGEHLAARVPELGLRA